MRYLFTLLACQGLAELEDTSKTVAPVADPGATTAVVAHADALPPEVMRMGTTAGAARALRVVPSEIIVPEGQVVVRDCYGYGERDRRSLGYGGGGASGSARSSSSARVSAPPAGPMPSAAPTSVAQASPPPAPAPTKKAEGRAAVDDMAGFAEAEMSAPAEPADGAVARPAREAARSEDGAMAGEKAKDATLADADAPALSNRWQEAQEEAGPQLDWGGTLFLSNDDSMSLASAQRLLWAVKNGASFSASQVRPHELLNYFSFDTTPVEDGATFSVHASAEQIGDDELAVALAVRGANPPREALDLTVLVDRSGSMSAEGRMDYLKRGMNMMTGSLQRGDRVNLVLFDSSVCTPLENYVVGRDDPSLLNQAIADMQPRGSTNLDLGLKEAYRLAAAHVATDPQERNRRVMVVTDAFLNTGDVNTNTVSEIGKAFEDHGIRMTGIGVGREFNDAMLDKLTEKGKGAYVYLGSEAVVDRVFGIGFESLTRTIAHDVRFALTVPPTLAVEKFYGEESSTNPDDIQPINYYAGTTQLFLQDLKARSPKKGDELRLTISWKDALTGEAHEQAYTTTVGRMLAADHHNVDKARALMAWTDMLTADAMGGSGCREGLDTYRSRTAAVGDDAEIAYIDGLVAQRCGVSIPKPEPALAGVAYKVKLTTDIPIAEVTMECSGRRVAQALGPGSNVASFTLPPGTCLLSLQGNVPMQTTVEVPSTGGDVRCTVKGGRMSCS
ncbi:MAG: VWA domain-containing protein [Pseudomonadota bacterium]